MANNDKPMYRVAYWIGANRATTKIDLRLRTLKDAIAIEDDYSERGFSTCLVQGFDWW